MTSDSDKLLYQIALTQVKGIGPIFAKAILQSVGEPIDLFKEKTDHLLAIPGFRSSFIEEMKRSEIFKIAEREISYIEHYQITPLFYTDIDYPTRLTECVDSPIMLYFKGNINLNQERIISIVGTRNATDTGRMNCEKLVYDLSLLFPNTIIISGLAYGIDVCAHRKALTCGLNTVGVLAHGLDKLYPDTHRSTASEMINQGGLLTEYMSRTSLERNQFVARNRIIAGLADATIVVESAEKGGALITADIANSYSRDVAAFPGRTFDTFSKGCNNLIKRNRAALISDANDFAEYVGWAKQQKNQQATQRTLFNDFTDDEEILVKLLQEMTDAQINIIAVKANMPISKVTTILFELEMKGVVRPFPGGIFRLI